MIQDEFSLEAIRRVPVAEGVLRALSFLFSEERIAALYEKHRGASYEREITFHTLVELMYSAVVEHQAVGNAAIESARNAGKLNVSDQATYGKIRRVRQSLSNALVCNSIEPLMEMFPDRIETRTPVCFTKYNVFCIDGKKLKDVAKRLKETRGLAGKLLGGKALVALSVHEQLVVAMSSSLDGEANDGPLVPELIKRLHEWSPKDNIILADSQFCDLTTPRHILAERSNFVVRYHPKVHFHVDPEVAAVESTDSQGRSCVNEIGWLGKPHTETCIRVRRITVKRDNAEDLILVTSLLNAKQFSTADILDLYSLRWTIETAFQHVTKEFDLRRMIGSTAEATLFQFAISLEIYNVMRLIQAHVSQARKISPEDVSLPKIADTTRKQLACLTVLVPADQAANTIQSGKQTAAQIAELLKRLWEPRWVKAKKKRTNTNAPPNKQSGAHTSVYRAILKYHAAKDV